MNAEVSRDRDFSRSTMLSGSRKLLQSECMYCGHSMASKTERGLTIAERAHMQNCQDRAATKSSS